MSIYIDLAISGTVKFIKEGKLSEDELKELLTQKKSTPFLNSASHQVY